MLVQEAGLKYMKISRELNASKQTYGRIFGHTNMYQCIWNGHLKGNPKCRSWLHEGFRHHSSHCFSPKILVVEQLGAKFLRIRDSKLSGEEEKGRKKVATYRSGMLYGVRLTLTVGGIPRRFTVVEKLFAVQSAPEKKEVLKNDTTS